jgi:RNA polymerase sigma-70 factor (ECF subfamily)
MTAPALDLDDLYERYFGLVIGYLRGQGATDPEDLASEVFVGVLRGLDRFDGDEAAFRSWILVIAHRRLLDERRRRGRKPAESVPPDRLHSVADLGQMGDVEGMALERLATTRVIDALSVLTDDQRTVVLLHTVGGLTLPQISEALGKRLAAVKSLHRRGLAAAARELTSASGQRAVWR